MRRMLLLENSSEKFEEFEEEGEGAGKGGGLWDSPEKACPANDTASEEFEKKACPANATASEETFAVSYVQALVLRPLHSLAHVLGGGAASLVGRATGAVCALPMHSIRLTNMYVVGIDGDKGTMRLPRLLLLATDTLMEFLLRMPWVVDRQALWMQEEEEEDAAVGRDRHPVVVGETAEEEAADKTSNADVSSSPLERAWASFIDPFAHGRVDGYRAWVWYLDVKVMLRYAHGLLATCITLSFTTRWARASAHARLGDRENDGVGVDDRIVMGPGEDGRSRS